MNVIQTEIERTALDLMRALRRYRKAKAAYEQAAFGITSADRDVAAPANKSLEDAYQLGVWTQGEISALGSALSGLCLSQMGESR